MAKRSKEMQQDMLILAHTGLTMGAARLIERGLPARTGGKEDVVYGRGPYLLMTAYPEHIPFRSGGIDYRLILLGSLLPDVIDKPVGIWAPWLGPGASQGVGHTLVLALVLLVTGWILYQRNHPGFLYMAIASTGQLVLDRMWEMPQILFWPLFGYRFPALEKSGPGRLTVWWHMAPASLWVYVPELIGGAILFCFFVRLWRCGGLGEFVRAGRVC